MSNQQTTIEDTPQVVYDVDYFINKFSAIPEDKWYIISYINRYNPEQRCALGHCGVTARIPVYEVLEARMLLQVFYPLSVTQVNDGFDIRYPQPTPKQRILAALNDLKQKRSNQA